MADVWLVYTNQSTVMPAIQKCPVSPHNWEQCVIIMTITTTLLTYVYKHWVLSLFWTVFLVFGGKELTINSLPCYACGSLIYIVFDGSVDYMGKTDLHFLSLCGSTLGSLHSDESHT